MKKTMSKRNVAKFHNLLKKKVSVNDIVKILKVDKETLKKFTPSVFKDLKEKAAEAAALAETEKQETAKAAEVVAEAAKQVVKKDK